MYYNSKTLKKATSIIYSTCLRFFNVFSDELFVQVVEEIKTFFERICGSLYANNYNKKYNP